MFSGITTILFSNFWQYPPYFVANSFNISAKYPPNIRQYPPYFAVNLLLTITNFPYFLFITMSKFVHYVDHIYPNLCIALTNFPQSMNNTVFCGIQFQISPNFCGFGNDSQGCPVIYAHDNREFFDCIVENNQKRLIFANITEKLCFWRVFTGVVGKCKKFLTFYSNK